MGAYLSEPMTTKASEDGDGNKLKFGSCSMQGWRVSQEDAHNCIASFDEGSSLFAVYDGHGGAEVAIYLSRHLPEVLKSCTAYKNGEFIKALEECYLKIDESIKTPEVLKEIQQLAKSNNSDGEAVVDYEEENVGALYEEATMPLDKLVAKYHSGIAVDNSIEFIGSDCKPGSSKSITSPTPSSSKNPVLPDNSSSSCSPGSSSAVKIESATETLNGTETNTDSVQKPSSSSVPSKIKTEDETIAVSSSSALPSGSAVKVEEKNLEPEKGRDCITSSAKEIPSTEAPIAGDSPNQSTSLNGNSSACTKSDTPKNVDTSVSGNQATISKLEAECAADVKVNGGSSATSESKSMEVDASSTPSATPRRKKVHPVPVCIENSKPERRSPRKSLQSFEGFDCSDSDESDGDDAGYNMDESDSENLDDEEEDLEEETSDDDDEDDDEEEDERFLSDIQEPGYDSGSTAVVCFMKWEADALSLWVANAGDSRCVVCREGKAMDMSHDHKPELDVEIQRIVKAGGKVTDDGRVNGGLNLSRAIGDHTYKQNLTLPAEEQMISPLPSVEHIALNPSTDKFVVLACDGVWNSMSSQEVVSFIDDRLQKAESLSKICEELFDACLSPDTCGDGTGCDNMTAIIVQLTETGQVFSGSKRKCNSVEIDENAEGLKKSRVD